MTLNPIQVLDHRQANTTQQLLPEPAIFSSSGWRDIHLELYQQPTFSTAEHQHTLHAIAYGLPNASGHCAPGVRYLDGKRTVEQRQAGDIAVIPAGVSHRCSWDGAAQFMVLAIEPNLFKQVGQDWVNPDQIELIPRFMTGPDPFIHSIFSTLRTEVASAGMGTQLLVDGLKTALIVHLLRHYCATQPKLSSYSGGLSEPKLSQVKAYINEYMDRDLTLVELGAIAQLSPYHFARLFKQSTGTTPHQYVLQCRIQRAQHLLRHSSLSLAEIAISVGFCDQSHLTRCFKRLVGVTPTKFSSD